jgi:CTP synthase (UTP-ammonia lyase)
MTRLALIGDYSPNVTAHLSIPTALQACGFDGRFEWLESAELARARLWDYAGLWVVPGSPYRDTRAVIAAIRFAREAGLPFLGTCGGYQHAIMEVAAALWGVGRAVHAEEEPEAANPVIAPLSCALVEVDGDVILEPRSRLRGICGVDRLTERYHCRYGFNAAYQPFLDAGPLRASARDEAGEIRAVELDRHRFFIGTAFQPERSGAGGGAHPVIRAFVRAMRA